MCDASEYECQELWLWMIRLGKNDSKRQKEGKMVTLNAWMSMHNGSECQNKRKMVTLNAWMSMHNGSERQNLRNMVAPNAKLDNGFECQNEDIALNVKLKKWL